MVFSSKIGGNHHLQGNVQVYNARIPVYFPLATRHLSTGGTRNTGGFPRFLTKFDMGNGAKGIPPSPRSRLSKTTSVPFEHFDFFSWTQEVPICPTLGSIPFGEAQKRMLDLDESR